jgi:hypothetical protein
MGQKQIVTVEAGIRDKPGQTDTPRA